MGANKPKKNKKRQLGKHFRPNIKKQPLRRLKLHPLDPQERDMAEEHHSLVLCFLELNGLSMEDYYDVVIFRYLMAVEKWFHRPELYPAGFSAMAWEAMSSALSCERARQRSCPRSVSMEEPVKGRGGLTWAETILDQELVDTLFTEL